LMVTTRLEYPGGELELFREAHSWKRYVRDQIQQFVRGDVLEVGSGIGATTTALHRDDCKSWTCLEPDGRLAKDLSIATSGLRDESGRAPHVSVATIDSLGASAGFDTILYIDVLEHIADDRGQLAIAAKCLRSDGHLIVMSPAHQWLFTPFDKAIGHHRRYSRKTLTACTPEDLRLVRLRYFDSVGIAASLANRFFLRTSMPTIGQIAVWDRWMVPLSRVVDPLLGFLAGKSILAIWHRNSRNVRLKGIDS